MKVGVVYLFTLSVYALHVAGQELTTYLLTRYAEVYHNVTTQPAFFHEVLNGTVTSEQVSYFFEQVRAAMSGVLRLRLKRTLSMAEDSRLSAATLSTS